MNRWNIEFEFDLLYSILLNVYGMYMGGSLV